MKIKIEKNIPVPARGYKYPIRDMEIGDSFLLDNEYSRKNMQSIVGYISQFRKKNNLEAKFMARKVDENKIRIWRYE